MRGRQKEEKPTKEELEMSMWEITAKEIGEEAWEEFGDDRRGAERFIYESVMGCEDVNFIQNAYENVSWTRRNNNLLFYKAKSKLSKIQGKDLDDIMIELAFLIIYERAMEYYHKLFSAVKEEKIK